MNLILQDVEEHYTVRLRIQRTKQVQYTELVDAANQLPGIFALILCQNIFKDRLWYQTLLKEPRAFFLTLWDCNYAPMSCERPQKFLEATSVNTLLPFWSIEWLQIESCLQKSNTYACLICGHDLHTNCITFATKSTIKLKIETWQEWDCQQSFSATRYIDTEIASCTGEGNLLEVRTVDKSRNAYKQDHRTRKLRQIFVRGSNIVMVSAAASEETTEG